MKATPLSIADVLLLEPRVFEDNRGHFFESFNQKVFEEIVGRKVTFVQDNQSRSNKNVLRGLHCQTEQPQGKLIRVNHGEIFDVAVDLRRQSPTFGQWTSAKLSAENRHQIWIPEGFAHGFLVLSDYADVLYKTTDYWSKQPELCIKWDDATLDIAWPLVEEPILSAKDLMGVEFASATCF